MNRNVPLHVFLLVQASAICADYSSTTHRLCAIIMSHSMDDATRESAVIYTWPHARILDPWYMMASRLQVQELASTIRHLTLLNFPYEVFDIRL